MEEPLILLNDKKIKKLLQDKSIRVDVLESVGSTSDYLKKNISFDKKMRVCLAEFQTQGKGRMNRVWHSPFGQNIYLSLLYSIQKDICELSGLSLVVGLAVCQAIENIIGLNDQILLKWPNDVVVNGLKMAGILIEIQAAPKRLCDLVIGIGVNVNMQAAEEAHIDQAWTSLQQLTHQYQDRNQLSAEIINQVIAYLNKFSATGLNPFMDEWKQKDSCLGKSIQLLCDGITYSGIGVGINAQGHYLLMQSDKRIRAFLSGNTTTVK